MSTCHPILIAAAALLCGAQPALAQDALPFDWWSHRTSSLNVDEVTVDGVGEMLRLGNATSGFLEGEVQLPAPILTIRELLFGVTTNPAGSLPGESVRLYVDGSLIREFANEPPGETSFDSLLLWGTNPLTNVIRYRFEFSSPVADPDRHLTVLRGAGLRRWFDVENGSVLCALAPNSVGPGVFLLADGSTSVSANGFRLIGSAGPPGQFGQFFYGPEGQRTPFGNGYLCIEGGSLGLVRLEPPLAFSASGSLDYRVDFTQPPAGGGPAQIDPGSTWTFQLWYRDPLGGGAGFSTSESLRVTFAP